MTAGENVALRVGLLNARAGATDRSNFKAQNICRKKDIILIISALLFKMDEKQALASLLCFKASGDLSSHGELLLNCKTELDLAPANPPLKNQ